MVSVAERNYTHGDSVRGAVQRLYRIWRGMNKRCYNLNDPHYKEYGGLGIVLCDEWKDSYINFKQWATDNGYDDDLTIERINKVTPHYCPENCEWVTQIEQGHNRRGTFWWVVHGKTYQSAQQAADYYNVSKYTICRWCGTRKSNGKLAQLQECYVVPKYYNCSLLKTPMP